MRRGWRGNEQGAEGMTISPKGKAAMDVKDGLLQQRGHEVFQQAF
jgi:hypothetical protein